MHEIEPHSEPGVEDIRVALNVLSRWWRCRKPQLLPNVAFDRSDPSVEDIHKAMLLLAQWWQSDRPQLLQKAAKTAKTAPIQTKKQNATQQSLPFI